MEKLFSVISLILVISSVFLVGMLFPLVVETSPSHILFTEMHVTNRLHAIISNIPVLASTVISTSRPMSMAVPKPAAKLTEGPVTTVTWATWAGTTTDVATDVATYTNGVRSPPPSPLLDRLVKDKPSIWASKAFYILLGAMYLTLLGLFLKKTLDTLKRQP